MCLPLGIVVSIGLMIVGFVAGDVEYKQAAVFILAWETAWFEILMLSLKD